MDREPKREPEWRKGWDGPHIALVVLAVVALALAGGLAWVEYGRHAEAMQALADRRQDAAARHEATMRGLADRRQDAAAQHEAMMRGLADRHEAMMRGLADRRQDAAAQHEATMTALQALIRNTAAPGSQTMNYEVSR